MTMKMDIYSEFAHKSWWFSLCKRLPAPKTSFSSGFIPTSDTLPPLPPEPATEAVTLFRFDSHFAAFRCTDLAIRAVDVLVTKPSELAFFPAARRR